MQGQTGRSHGAGRRQDEQGESWAARYSGSSCTGRSPGTHQISLESEVTKIRVSTLREKNWEYLLLLGVKVIIFSSNDLRSQAGGRAPYGGLETRILRQEAERCDNRVDLKSDGKVCQNEWFSLGQNCPRPQGMGRSWGCLWGCSSDWNSWRPFGSLERPDRTVAGPAHHTIYTINYTTGTEGTRATENTHDKCHCSAEISENIS